MNKCQQEFDEWAIEHGYPLDADSLGYKDSATSIALRAWQAAWDHPNRYKHPETRMVSERPVRICDICDIAECRAHLNPTQNPEVCRKCNGQGYYKNLLHDWTKCDHQSKT